MHITPYKFSKGKLNALIIEYPATAVWTPYNSDDLNILRWLCRQCNGVPQAFFLDLEVLELGLFGTSETRFAKFLYDHCLEDDEQEIELSYLKERGEVEYLKDSTALDDGLWQPFTFRSYNPEDFVDVFQTLKDSCGTLIIPPNSDRPEIKAVIERYSKRISKEKYLDDACWELIENATHAFEWSATVMTPDCDAILITGSLAAKAYNYWTEKQKEATRLDHTLV